MEKHVTAEVYERLFTEFIQQMNDDNKKAFEEGKKAGFEEGYEAGYRNGARNGNS